MSASPEGGLRRRLFVVLLVPAALVALVLIGRPTSSAAPVTSPSATPSIGADAAAAPSASSSASASVSLAVVDGGAAAFELQSDGAVVVDLNHAAEEDLRKLPGVGPTKARSILELRARLGSFKRLEDLARIKGFGRATLRRLRPFVRITPK